MVIAVGPAKIKRLKINARDVTTHTALMGVPVLGLIRYIQKEKGKAPSLANANTWRDVARV